MQEIFHLMKQPLTSLRKESKVCDDKGHSLKKGIFCQMRPTSDRRGSGFCIFTALKNNTFLGINLILGCFDGRKLESFKMETAFKKTFIIGDRSLL
jgi:hypothetical protein